MGLFVSSALHFSYLYGHVWASFLVLSFLFSLFSLADDPPWSQISLPHTLIRVWCVPLWFVLTEDSSVRRLPWRRLAKFQSRRLQSWSAVTTLRQDFWLTKCQASQTILSCVQAPVFEFLTSVFWERLQVCLPATRSAYWLVRYSRKTHPALRLEFSPEWHY